MEASGKEVNFKFGKNRDEIAALVQDIVEDRQKGIKQDAIEAEVASAQLDQAFSNHGELNATAVTADDFMHLVLRLSHLSPELRLEFVAHVDVAYETGADACPSDRSASETETSTSPRSDTAAAA